jgi:ABC-type nitrate/sulfonate/bicarbonate transport system ATPase subunit
MHLESKGLSFEFPSAEAPLFTDIRFRLEGPGFHALFGPSGVGKTTLARLLTRYPETPGTLAADGIATVLYSHNQERLPDWAGIGTHLDRVAAPGMEDRRLALVDRFGLAEHLEARFSQLSLGQKNRINLIRYLLQRFDMLILDESLANVDEKTRERILLSIKEWYPDRLFLYISHNIVEVAKFCRQILVLRSPHKAPQTVTVEGLDIRETEGFEHRSLEGRMLEIMNAV